MARTLALATVCLMACTPALADPGYYLVTVYENEGQANVDFRYWTVKMPGSAEVIWPEIGLGYGVSKRWYTELYASYIGSSGMATKLSTLNWQNDYLLTQGQYDFDLALHSNLIRVYDGSGAHSLEFGPALQTEIGRTQINANLVFTVSVHDGSPRTRIRVAAEQYVEADFEEPIAIGVLARA